VAYSLGMNKSTKIILSAIAIIGAANLLSSSGPIPAQTSADGTTLSQPNSIAPAPILPKSTTGLSNSNYYTNVNGNAVHSPVYVQDSLVPAGASARCRDGTYSFSQNRRGTCSHHGGVARWL
jgi:hypothetical protein